MSASVHSGLSVGITNQLAAIVFSCKRFGNIVVVDVIFVSGVDVVVGDGVGGVVDWVCTW